MALGCRGCPLRSALRHVSGSGAVQYAGGVRRGVPAPVFSGGRVWPVRLSGGAGLF